MPAKALRKKGCSFTTKYSSFKIPTKGWENLHKRVWNKNMVNNLIENGLYPLQSAEKKIKAVFKFSGIDKEYMDYILENPYVLYSAIASSRMQYPIGSLGLFTRPLRRVQSVSYLRENPLNLSLKEIVKRIERRFSYVDPKITRWFSENQLYPIDRITVAYYESLVNLSHSQVIDIAKQLDLFITISLGQALLIAADMVGRGLLDWPRKYLIIYVNDTYEGKSCRVLAYRYDNGSVEIYVNQMDTGDVWTPGVGYVFKGQSLFLD